MDVLAYQEELDNLSLEGGYHQLCCVFGKSKLPVIVFSMTFEPVYFNSAAFSAYRTLCLKDALGSYIPVQALEHARTEAVKTGLCRVEMEDNELFSAFIFTVLSVCGVNYLRLQIEEKYSFGESVKRLVEINDLENVVKNELLSPAVNIKMLLPLLRKYCIKTKDSEEKFAYVEKNIYTLVENACKFSEMAKLILNVHNVSNRAVYVSDFIYMIENDLHLDASVDDGVQGNILFADLESFSKISRDILDYMKDLKSLSVRTTEVLLEIYIEGVFVLFKFSRRSVGCPDKERIYEVSAPANKPVHSYFRVKAIADLYGYKLNIDYDKRKRMFITKVGLPLMFQDRAEDLLSAPQNIPFNFDK